MQNLGNSLKQRREALKLKQEWVSLQTGIPQAEISKIERGKRVLTIEHLEKFARFYNLQSVNETIKNIFDYE